MVFSEHHPKYFNFYTKLCVDAQAIFYFRTEALNRQSRGIQASRQHVSFAQPTIQTNRNIEQGLTLQCQDVQGL